MSENGLVGRSVEEVVAIVADRHEGHDRELVRDALDPITDDGVVTREAVETAVSDTSKVVATAETRVELAGIAFEDATDTAAPVNDLDIVSARIEEYADRLEAVESRSAALTAALQTPVDQLNDPNAVYELAVEIRDVATTAQGIARTADELSFDLEGFESWLTGPERRYDEFAEEIDLVEDSLDELMTAAAAIPTDTDEPAADWADATMRARVVDLLVADLRAELADLRTWAEREGVPSRATLNERVADLESRRQALADTLAECADPEWRDRFGEDLTAFERELATFEPPIDWGGLQRALEERRERSFDDR